MERNWDGGKIYRLVVIVSICAFGLALASYAYTGFFARYWADDYCYNATLRADGFWLAQLRFYQHTSDRYSVIPLVGISELFGPTGIRLWPAAAIALALAGLTWLPQGVAAVFGHKIGWCERFLFAEMIVFFTLWQAPNLFQVLYWRTGMLTYFMPLIVLVFLVGLIAHFTGAGRRIGAGMGIVFLLAVLGGGFSETNAALQAGLLGLAFAAALAAGRLHLAREQAPLLRRALFFTGAGLAGTLLALVLLFLSPSNQLRLVHMPEPANIPTLLRYSFRFGFDFIRDTLSSQPLPVLVSFLAPLGLCLAWGARRRDILARPGRLLGALAGTTLMTYLLVVCVCAPSVYVEVAYPEQRALIAARFVMVVGLSCAGGLVGILALALLRQLRLSIPLIAVAALLLVALTAVYPLRAAGTLLGSDLPYYRARALGWDERDREIRLRIEAGQREISAPALDSIGGLMELQPEPDVFPNTCVASAYGLSHIIGVIP